MFKSFKGYLYQDSLSGLLSAQGPSWPFSPPIRDTYMQVLIIELFLKSQNFSGRRNLCVDEFIAEIVLTCPKPYSE